MPWLDPARAHESDEDRALREELRGLLQLPSAPLLEAEVTPELAALADSLRHEAWRRRRTARGRRPAWLLLAAALPLALALGGLGTWGFTQKQRADALAQDLQRQRRDLETQLVAIRQELAQSQQNRVQPALQTARTSPELDRGAQPKGKELVIPAERTALPGLQGTATVKDRKGN